MARAATSTSVMRERISVRARVARRLDARLRFVRFALGAARFAIVVALVGEAFCVAVLIRVVVRNW
jgi:hypothetical protein